MIKRRNVGATVAMLGLAAVLMTSRALADEDGKALYSLQCIACHGAELQGVDGLGTTLADSELVNSSSADELIAFLKIGRMPNDPASLTGGVMPGFAWMPEADLRAIAAYLAAN